MLRNGISDLYCNIPAFAKLMVRHGTSEANGSENNCTTSVLLMYTHSSSPPEKVNISLPEKLKPVRIAAVNLKGEDSR